ncbi:MAG TPA: FHA domain-containing protein [Myxococcaceae bacterium]|nr:FHA domain-containing protein [Myxococcaceae bacterium]
MNDSEWTRFVRLRADVDRDGAENEGTRIASGRERVELVDHGVLFNRHQRRLMQIVRDQARLGVAVFALHRQAGIAGHFWLAATDDLRAGLIGRHGSVDLFLEDDDELSLRHLLVLVRRTPAQDLRIRIADLATPMGFQAEEGGLLRAVEANGTLVLRAASYSLFFFPTGGRCPWNPDAADPWSTLPPRVLAAEARPPRALPVRRRERRSENTDVRFREGPTGSGPEALLQRGERVEGHLSIIHGASEECLAVGARALERGVILGRYSRCTGDTTEMSLEVSRVHAILLRCDGELHLIDAGSTNGTFQGDQEVKCAWVQPGCRYRLGRMRVQWEPTH